MSGVRLAMSYGCVPCKLGLCGPEDKKKIRKIERYLKGDIKSEKEIRKIVREFKGAYPYYRLIAKSNKIKDPLSEKSVEAYWLGNSLLDKVSNSSLKKMMMKYFVPLGKISKKVVNKLPSEALACHNYHVFFLGSVTGKNNFDSKLIDICRVSWGKVEKKKINSLIVKYQPLKINKNVSLGRSIFEEIKWNKNILPEVKKGDYVSMHWRTAIQVLEPKEIKEIKKYTAKAIKVNAK